MASKIYIEGFTTACMRLEVFASLTPDLSGGRLDSKGTDGRCGARADYSRTVT